MNIKPILFNPQMVRAILDGRKTQTRRIAFPNMELREFCNKEYPNGWWFNGRVFRSFDDFLHYPQRPKCKYQPGDILWVRETWSTTDKCELFPPWPSTGTHYMYKGDSPEHELTKEARWFPSIHMPKEAARLFLRVTDVKLDRLRNITVANALREGAGKDIKEPVETTGISFSALDYGVAVLEDMIQIWDATIKRCDMEKYGWDANPWVWVIEFERCEKPEGWCK